MAAPKSSNEGSGGKLIDTWHYEYEGIIEEKRSDDENEEDVRRVQRVKPIKVAVELRIIKKYTGDTPPLSVRDVYFVLICKEIDLKFEGSDIEALRAAMWEKLNDKFKVKWELHYLVEIRPERPYQGVGTGFCFSYETVEKGTAWDGTLLLRRHQRHGKDEITPWPGQFKDRMGKVVACIPATKFNREALEQFRERIDEMRERLADYLRPAEIMKTLMGLNGINLLSTASEELAEKEN